MAANDELPRGLTLSSGGGGVGAGDIVFPAAAGIAWVLTDVYWALYVTGPFTSPILDYPTVTSGAVTLLTGYVAGPNGNQSGDIYEWSSSEKLAGLAGQALTVHAPAQYPGLFGLLHATAYPI